MAQKWNQEAQEATLPIVEGGKLYDVLFFQHLSVNFFVTYIIAKIIFFQALLYKTG